MKNSGLFWQKEPDYLLFTGLCAAIMLKRVGVYLEAFFKLKRPDEVFEIIDRLEPLEEESVFLEGSLGRVLSRDLSAPEDLPGFFRSTMDGYAVRARDTFGATESLPALFELAGEVAMGRSDPIIVEEGEAVKIPTGGMIPEGADGVVMDEYCALLDGKTVEISKAISPLENIIQPGDDFKAGDLFLQKGERLRPQDLGVAAGLGFSHIPVVRMPKVAIISTGDEIVPVEDRPLSGQVRDINRYTLGAFCRELGAEPIPLGICRDDFHMLKDMVEEGAQRADSVWVSGGSSVGTRDLTLKVFETLPGFELLVHGISISPGKPTILGKSGGKIFAGLPGHVASALVVAKIFMSRVILRLRGENHSRSDGFCEVEAELSRNVESANGREDYLRVLLVKENGRNIAKPVFGKSGLISTLVDADGLVKMDMNTEGLYAGDRVKVMLFRQGGLS